MSPRRMPFVVLPCRRVTFPDRATLMDGGAYMPRRDPVDIWALSDLCTPWCVHVVATLRIADHIDAGITRIDDLAGASGSDRDSLHRVLRHLVGEGMFEEPSPGRFALNEPARGLLDPSARLGLDLD